MAPEEEAQQQQLLQLLGNGMAGTAGGQLADRGSQIDAIVDAAMQGQGAPQSGGPGAVMAPPSMPQQPPSGPVLTTIMQRLRGLLPVGAPAPR